MRNFTLGKASWRIVQGAAGALALAVGVSLLASPAYADHHCWRCRSDVVIGLGFYAPPPVYYAPPPVYYAPAPAYYYPAPPPMVVEPAPMIVQQYRPTCENGDWRQDDGSIVSGIACLQPNGTWRLAN